ncbi:MAG: TetR/AcrR family transcriptional regulator [Roseburia sp.]|nr:TetR/AcrR family transcriptional regulator [Roseburia sp.]
MKTDARVRYTRMRIREAFFACLEEKPVNKITVKEICDLAEINRATFYKHYADPFDLMQKLEEEVIEGMQKSIESSGGDSSHSLLLSIIKGMMNKENSYALLTSPNGDPGFASRISELFYEGCRPRLGEHMSGCTEAEKDAAYLFIAGGCGNLLSAWVKDGMQASPEQVADTLRTICSVFMESYIRRK